MRLFLLLLCLLALVPRSASAQDTSQIGTITKALDTAALQLPEISQGLDQPIEPAAREDLRARATAVRQAATDGVAALTPLLAQVDARILQLGTPTPDVPEAPDIRAQRRLLAQQRSVLDSAIKRGRLMLVDAGQLIDEINQNQAQAFSERMGSAAASPLSPGFWSAIAHAAPRDTRRVMAFVKTGMATARKGLAVHGPWPAVVGGLMALILFLPVRLALRRLGRHYVIARAPGSRVRRSAYALWLAVVGTLVPGIAALALVQGLRWSAMLSPGWDQVARVFVLASFISAFVTALGGALVLRRQASWRLLDISDATAEAIRPWTWAAAGLAFASAITLGFNGAVGASYAAREAADGLFAILYALLIAGTLLTIGRLRVKAAAADDGDSGTAPARQSGIAAVAVGTWVLVAMALVALLLGYINLSLFITRFTVWIAVVVGAFYLLLLAADDIIMTTFSSQSRLGHVTTQGLGVRPSAVDQFGVILSAVVRLILFALGIIMALGPFGSNVGSLLDQASLVSQGVTVGQITISPGAILRAVLVLAGGLFVVRTIQRWLTDRYLPTTEMDAGARNSISMVVRYSGVILATLWALASLGIGIERIALLLSALSVGIGFGLQAITQNFVSGLILLAERPVKIGDLVRIGDQEGDVKRISVRATEIQIADRSTLIVPNSEMITKTIRNMTLADPIGRFQLQFSVQLGTDIAKVSTLLKAMLVEATNVLEDPEPKIFIDSILDGRVNFNVFAYVTSPRAAYSARSDMLFQLLARLPAEGIDLGTAHQQLELIGPPLPKGEDSALRPITDDIRPR